MSNNNLAHKIVKVFLQILINFNIQFLHVLNEKDLVDPVENAMHKLSCYKKNVCYIYIVSSQNMLLEFEEEIFIIGGYDFESGMTHVVLVDKVD